MAYASSTGALKVSSRRWNTVGESDEEQDRMNRILGSGLGKGEDKRIEWIVGTIRSKE